MGNSIYIRHDEYWTTYIGVPVTAILHRYTVIRAYQTGINFVAFIIIQALIVFLTMLIDVHIFGRDMNGYNILGGVICILTTAAAMFYF